MAAERQGGEPGPERERTRLGGGVGGGREHLERGGRGEGAADDRLGAALLVGLVPILVRALVVLRRVDEGLAHVDRELHRPQPDIRLHRAEPAADRPGAEADGAHPAQRRRQA